MIRRITKILTLTMVVISMTGCFLIPGSGDNGGQNNDGAGSIKINLVVPDEQQSRSFLPGTDMEPGSFLIKGHGPNGSYFEREIDRDGDTTSETITGLTFGQWRIDVVALSGGTGTRVSIGQGSAEVLIQSNQETPISITLEPYDGSGTLNLVIDWGDAVLGNPEIEATLTRFGDDHDDYASQVEFDIDGNYATIQPSSATRASGYYTLIVRLYDNTGEGTIHPFYGGLTAVVWILDSIETDANITIKQNSGYGYGDAIIYILYDLDDPVNVLVDDAPSYLFPGEEMTAHAIVEAGESPDIVYTWYLNSEDITNDVTCSDDECTLGSDLNAGMYRLDVTAFTPDGERGGSAEHEFQVFDYTGSQTAHWALDEGAGVTASDSTGNGSNGAIVGAIWDDGLSFDGTDGTDDYVNCGNYSILNNPYIITASAWVRNGNNATSNGVISMGSADSDGWAVTLSDTSFGVEYSRDGETATAQCTEYPVQDEWHHIAVTIDNITQLIYFYIDGILKNTVQMSYSYDVNSSRNMYLGSRSAAGGFWAGHLEDVQIYNYPLEEKEVEVVYSDNDHSGPGPSSPGTLSVTDVTSDEIVLSWSNDPSNEEGFTLERAGDENFDPVTEIDIDPNITTYTDTTVSANTTYYYRIYAYNIDGNSNNSNEINVTTDNAPPIAPDNLAATDVTTTEITLTWDDNSTNETGFRIGRSDDCTGTYAAVDTTAADVETYIDTGLTPDTDYCYIVVAYNGEGDSASSNVVTTATLADSGGTLVAHYTFDEGTGTTAGDSSGNGNDGTIYGATWTTEGAIGNAIEFDGDNYDYIDCGNDTSLDVSDNFTVAMWVYIDADSPVGSYMIPISKYSTNASGWNWTITAYNATELGRFMRFGYHVPSVERAETFDEYYIPNAEWHHLAVILDNSNLQAHYYVDGVFNETQGLNNLLVDNDVNLFLGKSSYSTCPYYGMIDDLRIYQGSLEDTEILSLYNMGGL